MFYVYLWRCLTKLTNKYFMQTSQVDRRYTELKAIGKGSYGVVASALDAVSQQRVAIKKISPMAAHAQDAKHVLREIRLMRYLGVHENIITLKNLSMREQDDELYIVMELLDSDLHRIIQSSQGLSDAHHRYFMHQLLKGVNYLHKHNVIHRDLKPGNLLVTRNCELRITDFGLARLKPTREGEDGDEIEEAMTEHVVTRWYRPPELMLCPDGLYTSAVDMWSVGCIFAELLGRKPLFPGKNFVHQLTLIFDVIGSPRPSQVSHIKSRQAKKFLASVQGKTSVDFSTLYPSSNSVAVDLLKKMLVFEPNERLDAAAALAHPYFDAIRNSSKSPEPPVSAGFEFDFESQNLSRGRLKALVTEEVRAVQRTRRSSSSATTKTVTESTSSARAAARVAEREQQKLLAQAKEREIREKEREMEREKRARQAAAANASEEKERKAQVLARAKERHEHLREQNEEDASTPRMGRKPPPPARRQSQDENKIPNHSSSTEPPPIPKRPLRSNKARYSEQAMLIAQGLKPDAPKRAGSGRDLTAPTQSSAAAAKLNPRANSAAGMNRRGKHDSQPAVRSRSAGGSNEQGLYGGPVRATHNIEDATLAAEKALAAGRAANAGVRARSNSNSSDQLKRKPRTTTVPQSPKFSVMSWQKKMERRQRILARSKAVEQS